MTTREEVIILMSKVTNRNLVTLENGDMVLYEGNHNIVSELKNEDRNKECKINYHYL